MSRRAFLGGGLVFGATVLLTACGPDADGRSGGSGAWSFTDDTGDTVRLDKRTTRIAGLNDAIASLWNYGVVRLHRLADDINFEGKDLSKVTEVDTTYGRIDIEALAAPRPDVVVTHAYPVDSSGSSTRRSHSTASTSWVNRRRPAKSP